MLRKLYSTATATATATTSSTSTIKVHALNSNGIGYGSSVSLVLPVGSRYQGSRVVGASHFLKNILPLSNEENSAGYNARATEIIGANWNAYLDRENLYFTLEGPKKKLDHSIDLLSCTCKYKEGGE